MTDDDGEAERTGTHAPKIYGNVPAFLNMPAAWPRTVKLEDACMAYVAVNCAWSASTIASTPWKVRM